MNSNLIRVSKGTGFTTALNKYPAGLRAVLSLDNGNLAIVQITDPRKQPWTAMVARKVPAWCGGRLIRSLEAGIRVGYRAFTACMRGPKPRQGTSKKDRKV